MNRQIKTCHRCRLLKVRCDRLQPTCRRCSAAGVECSFQTSSQPQATESTSSAKASPSTNTSSTANNSLYMSHTSSRQLRIRKGKLRQRACLSCVRCHRLKVKCDKTLPCSRCRLSGFGRHCEYTHRIESTQPPDLHDDPAEDPTDTITAWHTRLRGPSHWKELVNKVDTLAQLVSPLYRYTAELPGEPFYNTGVALPVNFPISSSGVSHYTSLEAVRTLIKEYQPQCAAYVDAYMATIHPVHPIVSPAQVQDQIHQLGQDQAFNSPIRLSQFCMVLALGNFSADGTSQITRDFCLAAEACLTRTAFMVRPTLDTLRTMCLMLMAKQITASTCWALDSCWTLMGFLIRQAASLGLHRPPRAFHEYNPDTLQDWQAGQMIWVTILYFSIQVSLTSGMASFVHMDDVLQTSETFTLPLNVAEQAWQTPVRSSFPVILHITARVNSDNDEPTYPEVLEYNSQIRDLMGVMDSYQLQPVLRITLDIHFRRALLIMHRRYALEVDAPYRYPVSYWSSLECSLALLVHHREMAGTDIPRHFGVIARFYMLDFFAAALTACIHLLRQDAPLAGGVSIPPRQTIYDTLEACVEIWAQEDSTSRCYRSGYRLLQSIFNMLPTMHS